MFLNDDSIEKIAKKVVEKLAGVQLNYYLSRKEYATQIGVSVSYVDWMIRRRELFVRREGRRVLILRDELLKGLRSEEPWAEKWQW